LILAVSYLSDQIVTAYGDGSEYGVTIRYAIEPVGLGTAGAVKNAAPFVETEDFLVLNGDTYAQLDYGALAEYHHRHQADLTITLRQADANRRYGWVELKRDGRIARFAEKGPAVGEQLINAGVYVMNRRVLSWIPDQHQFAMETELIPLLLQNDLKMYGWITDGYFRDIGVPEDYYQFIRDIETGLC
jgi:NDP-sugar pyrophosphorylase family protein